MMEAEKLDAGRESNEVELSTEDLLAMSQSARPAADESAGSLAAAGEGKASRRGSNHAPGARRMSVAAIMLTIGAIAAAAAAVVAIVPMDREPELVIEPAPPPEPIIEEPALPDVEGPPVLFTNPFDETEVFEFPPGTSREEARAAVADLLIMRARERMELFEARGNKR